MADRNKWNEHEYVAMELSIKKRSNIHLSSLNSVLLTQKRDRQPEDFRKPQTGYTHSLVIDHGSTRKRVMWTVLTPSGRGQLWQKLVWDDAVSETDICEGGEKTE